MRGKVGALGTPRSARLARSARLVGRLHVALRAAEGRELGSGATRQGRRAAHRDEGRELASGSAHPALSEGLQVPETRSLVLAQLVGDVVRPAAMDDVWVFGKQPRSFVGEQVRPGRSIVQIRDPQKGSRANDLRSAGRLLRARARSHDPRHHREGSASATAPFRDLPPARRERAARGPRGLHRPLSR